MTLPVTQRGSRRYRGRGLYGPDGASIAIRPIGSRDHNAWEIVAKFELNDGGFVGAFPNFLICKCLIFKHLSPVALQTPDIPYQACVISYERVMTEQFICQALSENMRMSR